MDRNELGRTGESLSARYLQSRGWNVLDRNVRYREGELDLVAERAGILAFIEVKTRRSRAFGSPAEAVTRVKAARIRRLASRYLTERRPRARDIRFDVIDVLRVGENYQVTHLEDVF